MAYDDDHAYYAYLDVEEDEFDDTDVEYPEPNSIDDPTWFSIHGDY